MLKKYHYLQRIYKAYVAKEKSQLTFWHDKVDVNRKMEIDKLGQYYMPFHMKADYASSMDNNGIPLLNYHGVVGLQYNPIAIAQYGLGNYNLWCDTKSKIRYENFIKASDWLVNNLKKNKYGIYVWMHDFDFEYFKTLRSPWYSGLAQGQGISLLVRAASVTSDPKYFDSAKKAFKSMQIKVEEGGVIDIDKNDEYWIEEYILVPHRYKTKILNGFIWALWGVYDYFLYTKDEKVLKLFNVFVKTIVNNIQKYDCGYWSYYELTPQMIKSIASPFYHSLHITQLKIMYEITGNSVFNKYSIKWAMYNNNTVYKKLAFIYKAAYKILFY